MKDLIYQNQQKRITDSECAPKIVTGRVEFGKFVEFNDQSEIKRILFFFNL